MLILKICAADRPQTPGPEGIYHATHHQPAEANNLHILVREWEYGTIGGRSIHNSSNKYGNTKNMGMG